MSDIIKNFSVGWWREITQMTKCPKKEMMTSVPKRIMALKLTLSGLEKHWARVQSRAQIDKIGLKL